LPKSWLYYLFHCLSDHIWSVRHVNDVLFLYFSHM
jgi:hypothetical protein